MCIIHAEQKLADLSKLHKQCLANSQEWNYLNTVIFKHKEALEALRLAEMCCGNRIHEIESKME
jgi:hypothetical protein